ncbi:MAG TPA: 30S ribosomal protein S20 [Candidatus Pacearchaeota archaeon]|nr:30S ribosomal protein S20 [Candidatus Paceibacterota bacterium]HOK00559.1 30S ribosomal protein S20 [Candidatus Pacearchaeota archaeon]HOL90526.1 30S ribosomal protein S20 [Candidatus Pacearchaeota archaeon]HPO68217.1 30S ribosomal protein S20 [Candidatus Pacearchaeota archaeon]
MPITKSAEKALRQSLKRREENDVYRKKIKTLSKKIKVLISEKKFEEAKNLLPEMYKALDKAAKRGVIKKNTASRKKSRIAKSLIKSQKAN